MKHLKTLGLAVIAAAALTAFLGATSASGTVLCTTTLTSGCATSGWDIPKGSVIETSQVGTGSLETLSGSILDTCTGATVDMTTNTTGSSSETVTGRSERDKITWEDCTKTTDTLLGATWEIHWNSSTDTGTVTIKEGEVTVNTIFGTCVFGFPATGRSVGDLTGSYETPILHINTIVNRLSGLCPAEERWTATFHVTGITYPGQSTVIDPPLFVSTS